jgi:hypothetical protein
MIIYLYSHHHINRANERGVQLVHPSGTRESLKGPITLSIDRANERGVQLVHPSGTHESLKGPITLSIDRVNERGISWYIRPGPMNLLRVP